VDPKPWEKGIYMSKRDRYLKAILIGFSVLIGCNAHAADEYVPLQNQPPQKQSLHTEAVVDTQLPQKESQKEPASISKKDEPEKGVIARMSHLLTRFDNWTMSNPPTFLKKLRSWSQTPFNITVPGIGNIKKLFHVIQIFARSHVREFVADVFDAEDPEMFLVADAIADSIMYSFITCWLTPGAYLDLGFMRGVALTAPLFKCISPSAARYGPEALKITYLFATRGIDLIGFAGAKLYGACARPYLPKWIPQGGWREWFILTAGLHRFEPYVTWNQDKSLLNMAFRSVEFVVQTAANGISGVVNYATTSGASSSAAIA
jgi:hypothetical protein